MSVTTRNPLRMVGGQVYSGAPNTGELPMTRGGAVAVCVYSGALLIGSGGSTPLAGGTTGHAVFWSGAGRLNQVVIHQAISGVTANFYDSYTVARSGVATIPESGYRILAATPKDTWYPYGTLQGVYPPISYDVPFTLGLAVSLPSGCPGITATFTPEVNPSVG